MSPLLTQVQAVHRALATVRRVRRTLLSVAAGLVCVLLLRIIGGIERGALGGVTVAVDNALADVFGVVVGAAAWLLLGRRGKHEPLTGSAVFLLELIDNLPGRHHRGNTRHTLACAPDIFPCFLASVFTQACKIYF